MTARSFPLALRSPLCSSGLLWEGVRRVVRFKEWLSCCPVRSFSLHDGDRPTFDFSEGFGYLRREIDSVSLPYRAVSRRELRPLLVGNARFKESPLKGVTALSFLWCFARCARCLITLFISKKKILLQCESERASELSVRKKKITTLSGGSLGSCVDEERSQLRELM